MRYLILRPHTLPVLKKIYRLIYKRYSEQEAKSILPLLRSPTTWMKHPVLHRWMRKYCEHGHSRLLKQMILDDNCYTWFLHNNKGYVKIMSLKPGKRKVIPLTTNHPHRHD